MSQSADQPGPGQDAPAPVQRDTEQREVLSPGEGLPAVKAPDTSFLMQLFVYPLAIVCSIALVVVLVNLVSTSRGDPRRHLPALERNNRGRWQAAHNLAMDMARSDGAIRSDSQFAARLAAILDRELDQTYDKKDAKAESINFRLYLCLALGEFHVDDGLPALLRAAQEQLADDEVAARCTAIGAIARLAATLRESHPIDSPEVIAALLKASNEEDTAVVRTAAVALGSVGGQKAIERLKELTTFNYHPSVRYTAAVKLAVLGEAASVDVLLEMLDLENEGAIAIDVVGVDGTAKQLDEEKDKQFIDQLRANAQAVVLLNALRATSELSEKRPSVDLDELIVAIEAIIAADLREQLPRDKADAIRDKAVEVLAELKME